MPGTEPDEALLGAAVPVDSKAQRLAVGGQLEVDLLIARECDRERRGPAALEVEGQLPQRTAEQLHTLAHLETLPEILGHLGP